MMRSILADSGPLYAAADTSDALHHEAQEQLQALAQTQRNIVVAYPVLLESYSLVLFRMGAQSAHKWLSFFSDASLMNPTDEDYRQAIARVRALPDQRITLVDAILATVALRLKLKVWTYDHHFDVMRVPVWRGSGT
jgi:predicted nucleic acid-binding protein